MCLNIEGATREVRCQIFRCELSAKKINQSTSRRSKRIVVGPRVLLLRFCRLGLALLRIVCKSNLARFPHFPSLIVKELLQRRYTLHRQDCSQGLGRSMANHETFLQISKDAFKGWEGRRVLLVQGNPFFLLVSMFQHVVLVSPLEYMAVTRDNLGSGSSPTFANSSTLESTLNLALTCTPHKRRKNVQIRTIQIVKLQPTLGRGHYTYNCKAAAVPYKTRPSRTQILENPENFSGVPGAKRAGGPRVEVPEELLSKCALARLRVFGLDERHLVYRKGLSDKILSANAN